MPRKQPKPAGSRSHRLQILVSAREVQAIDEFRFTTRQANRAEAVRALLRSGMGHQEYADVTRQAGLLNNSSYCAYGTRQP
jgi:hypothetical protein